MENVLVSIPGGNGRMGKTLIGLILEYTKFNLAHATCFPGEDEEGMDIGLLVGRGKISKELKKVYEIVKNSLNEDREIYAPLDNLVELLINLKPPIPHKVN